MIFVVIFQYQFCLILYLIILPGTTSGGTINEIQETTTNNPVGRYTFSCGIKLHYTIYLQQFLGCLAESIGQIFKMDADSKF